MSNKAAQLLETFEALPVEERQAVLIEIFRRTRDIPIDSGPLDDADIGYSGTAFLAHLDREDDVASKG